MNCSLMTKIMVNIPIIIYNSRIHVLIRMFHKNSCVPVAINGCQRWNRWNRCQGRSYNGIYRIYEMSGLKKSVAI